MASIVLEAILNEDCGVEQIAKGCAGFIKCADLVSDFFFIGSLYDFVQLYPNQANAQFGLSTFIYMSLASIFTGIGITFDALLTVMAVKEWKQKKEDKKNIHEIIQEEGTYYSKKVASKFINSFFSDDLSSNDKFHWVWWKNINFFIEEIPQLLILLVFWIDWGSSCSNTNTTCTDETRQHMKSVQTDAIVSGLFTSLTVTRVLVGFILYRVNKVRIEEGKEEIKVPTPNIPTPNIPKPTLPSVRIPNTSKSFSISTKPDDTTSSGTRTISSATRITTATTTTATTKKKANNTNKNQLNNRKINASQILPLTFQNNNKEDLKDKTSGSFVLSSQREGKNTISSSMKVAPTNVFNRNSAADPNNSNKDSNYLSYLPSCRDDSDWSGSSSSAMESVYLNYLPTTCATPTKDNNSNKTTKTLNKDSGDTSKRLSLPTIFKKEEKKSSDDDVFLSYLPSCCY